MKKTFVLNGGVKCTDTLGLDREEATVEIIDFAQKMVAQANTIFHSSDYSVFEKYRRLDNLESSVAAISNCLSNSLGIDVRDANGYPLMSELFNRVFYFRQMAEIEWNKEAEGGTSND